MRYNSLSENLISRYGCKVYRLAIEGGFTCPNRDGKRGTGGCIFCAEGSGSFARNIGDVNAQLDAAKVLVADKCKSGKYIAYFQSYTATYMPAEIFKERLMAAATREDIVAISVATRPDCIDGEILLVLKYVSRFKPITVELGLQTANDKTGELINRCFNTEDYVNACRQLHGIGVEVVAHVIIGLPEEDLTDVLETVELVNLTADGIKLQLMHVLRDTVLCNMYECGNYVPLSLEEYTDILCECITHLSKHIVVHRLTGDGDKRLLAAPMWSADKKRVLNFIRSEFERRNISQGSVVSGQ